MKNYSKKIDKLQNSNWLDVNVAWTNLQSNITTSQDELAPVTQVR